MGETFCTCYAMVIYKYLNIFNAYNITQKYLFWDFYIILFILQPSEDHPGSHVEFAKKRLSLGENLYFKALEDIMLLEQRRLPPKTDFSVSNIKVVVEKYDFFCAIEILPYKSPFFQNMLDLDAFHRSLFACCLEIVIFSYNSQR